jgi:VanZ family protein
LLFHAIVFANEENASKNLIENLSKGEKLAITNVAIASGVLIWGFTQWGYGEENFHFDNEGWFEKETSNGGSDKLGHFYTNYLMARVVAPIYESWGYKSEDAALYAALTAGMLSGILIELGDGFSEHGFSSQDFIADVLGAAAGYFWHINPSLAQKIDFRVEYAPSLHSDNVTDFTTDYEHMKHLVAIKANGF